MSHSKSKLTLIVLIVANLIAFSLQGLAQQLESPDFSIEGDSFVSNSTDGNSADFGLSGQLNPFAGVSASSDFRAKFGYNSRIQANVPYKPTLTNPSEYYNRLRLTIDDSSNSSDTLFAIAISSNNWATYQFVQDDYTVDFALGIEDYNTFTHWGDVSGFSILDLTGGTAYKVKVKALNGDFTETEWGPESDEVETDVLYLKVSDIAEKVEFGLLSASSVATGAADLTLQSNSEPGVTVQIYGTGDGVNPGLYNGTHTIVSATALLAAGTEGYGVAANSVDGLNVAAAYDKVAFGDVGIIPLTASTIATSSTQNNSPTSSLNLSLYASISGNTPSGQYQDVIYYIVSTNL